MRRSISDGSLRRRDPALELARKLTDEAAQGQTTVWRIENFQEVEVPKERHGQFYAGDSYIIKYTYIDNHRERTMLYFWLGGSSSSDEKGAAALIATRMDDELGGAATQIRVVMGKEPPHLIAIFAGRMVVHAGGCASGYKNRGDCDTYDTDGISLFQIKARQRGSHPLLSARLPRGCGAGCSVLADAQ